MRVNAADVVSHDLESLEPRALMHGSEFLEALHIDLPANHPQMATVVMVANSVNRPHVDNLEKQTEHEALFDLVKHEDATHVSVKDGLWSSTSTWSDIDGDKIGDIPSADADVLIDADTTVTYDQVSNVVLHTVRVDGTLHFAHDRNTLMIVDTLVVDPQGNLEIGTEKNPIAPDVFAIIEIADNGPIDTDWDPLQLSRGLISHGRVEIHGAAKTPYVALESSALRGDTELVLSNVPTNWRVGDSIVLTGSHRNGKDFEERSILAIDGNRVTISKLKENHVPPEGQSVYVANTLRNVFILSQNTQDIAQRGHAMFMHSNDVRVHNAGFYGLGRTDKSQRINEPQFDDDGHLIKGTGTNQRGRYAAHFHRNGASIDRRAAIITGSVVAGSPGWGFVNHDSHVIMEDNVSFDVFGAGFVTEFGNEIGAFRRNLAIGSQGSSDSLESRMSIFDFGHQGHGFWFQGGGVEVVDNIAADHADAAFIYYTRISPVEFNAANLSDPSIAGGRDTLKVNEVPIRLFKGNEALTSSHGLKTWFNMLSAEHDGRSVIEDFTVWGTRSHGITIPYTRQADLIDVNVINNVDNPRWIAIDSNSHTEDILYDNPRLIGWEIGIDVPLNGHNEIHDGRYSNVKNIRFTNAWGRGRHVEINGSPVFDRLSDTALAGEQQWNIFLDITFDAPNQDLSKLFTPDTIILNMGLFGGKQLYFLQQDRNSVPFPVGDAPDFIPPQLIGKTNKEMWDQYGLAIGGVLPPLRPIARNPRINGLITIAAPPLPDLMMRTPRYTAELEDYQLVYVAPDGQRVYDQDLIDLHLGWNPITRTVDGVERTFFVYGDHSPPRFEYDYDSPLIIHPSKLSDGFTVHGYVIDDSTGRRIYSRTFSGSQLEDLPIATRSDGSRFVVLEFKIGDRAGNRSDVALELTLDPNA